MYETKPGVWRLFPRTNQSLPSNTCASGQALPRPGGVRRRLNYQPHPRPDAFLQHPRHLLRRWLALSFNFLSRFLKTYCDITHLCTLASKCSHHPGDNADGIEAIAISSETLARGF